MNNIKTPGAIWTMATIVAMVVAKFVAQKWFDTDFDVWFSAVLNNAALVAGVATSVIGFLATVYASMLEDAKDSVVSVESVPTRGVAAQEPTFLERIKDIL